MKGVTCQIAQFKAEYKDKIDEIDGHRYYLIKNETSNNIEFFSITTKRKRCALFTQLKISSCCLKKESYVNLNRIFIVSKIHFLSINFCEYKTKNHLINVDNYFSMYKKLKKHNNKLPEES